MSLETPPAAGEDAPAGAPRANRAAIIAIGSEMLSSLRQDTNSLWLTARLEEVGISVVRKSIVPDDPEAIGDEISFAARAANLIVMTGGLGPAADDVTVAAVARRLEMPLARNEEYVAWMRERFARRGIRMPAVNEKQADFIVGAKVLENPRGTAPGSWIARGGREYVILPGVPSEMREIMEERVLPVLRERAGRVRASRRVLRVSGMGESAVEELVAPVYAKWKDDPGVNAWRAFLDKYYADADRNNDFVVQGYNYAQVMVQVLKQCGDDLTRENVMRQAANLKDVQLGMLLPGIKINTSPTDYAPLKQLQFMKLKGESWELFGEIINSNQ